MLKNHKLPGESFSQTILRLLQSRGDPHTILQFLQQMDTQMANRFATLADTVEDVYLKREEVQLRDLDKR